MPFFLIVLVLSIGITPTLSFSDSIDSPRKQVANGATPESVICKAEFTLMIRQTGDAACVKPTTAEKLSSANWGEIEKEFTFDCCGSSICISFLWWFN